MALLTKEQAQPPELETRDIEMPEFNGTLRVREWTGKDRDDWSWAVSRNRNDPRGARAAAVAVSAIGEDGELLFSVESDLPEIQKWPDAAVERVWRVVRSMNGIGKEEEEESVKN